jgi:DNA-binding winged helix-turn-helix (wHTH) protein
MRMRFGDCVLDSDVRQFLRGERVVSLQPKVFQLLETLVRARPKALSKSELHQALWPDTFVSDANLANLVADLREALGDDARSPRIIRTVQRFGYAFQAEVSLVDGASAGASAFRLLWGDREIALSEGENVLGRDRGAVVWIDVYSVSRHHAKIVISGSSAVLEDLGSKNGTFLRGVRVSAPMELADGDEIRIGTVPMTVRRFAPGKSTMTARSQ